MQEEEKKDPESCADIKVHGKLPESDIDYSLYADVAQLMDTDGSTVLILKSDSSQNIEMIRSSIGETEKRIMWTCEMSPELAI